MNDKMYKQADRIIEKSKIVYGDKIHLLSVVKRARRLEGEVVQLVDENEGLNEEFNIMMLTNDFNGASEKRIIKVQKENEVSKKENILYKKQLLKLRNALETIEPQLDPLMKKYIKDTLWEIDTMEKTIQ
jgi:hypothetical protein